MKKEKRFGKGKEKIIFMQHPYCNQHAFVREYLLKTILILILYPYLILHAENDSTNISSLFFSYEKKESI